MARALHVALTLFALASLACGTSDAVSAPAPQAAVTPEPPKPTTPRAKPAEAELRPLCEQGQLDTCIALGDRLRERTAPEQPDFAGAVELYDRACMRASRRLHPARADVPRRALRSRRRRARRDLYTRGCEAGAPRGCSRLGSMYLTGFGVERSIEQAHARSEAGCSGGDGLGCANLSLMHKHGDGVKRDLGRALELARKSCDADEARGCTLLGEMISAGEGTSANTTLGVMYNTKGCQLGDGRGCGNVGVASARSGHRPEPRASIQMYGKGLSGRRATLLRCCQALVTRPQSRLPRHSSPPQQTR